MNIKICRVPLLGTLESGNRHIILVLFEIGQPEPVLELGIFRPASRYSLAEFDRFRRMSGFEVAEQQAPVHLDIVWRQLIGLLENADRANVVTRFKRSLAAAN